MEENLGIIYFQKLFLKMLNDAEQIYEMIKNSVLMKST